MNRIAPTALLAGLLTALAPGSADAEPISYSPNPFTGSQSSYTTIGSKTLPYTDSFGTTLTTTNSTDAIGANGLIFTLSSNTDSLTWTLNHSVKEVGFTFNTTNSNSGITLESITLSNGDSSTTYTPSPSTTGFMAFYDNTAFSVVTLKFTGSSGESADLTKFTFAPAVVPEPASVVNIALAAAGLAGLAYRQRQRQRQAASS